MNRFASLRAKRRADYSTKECPSLKSIDQFQELASIFKIGKYSNTYTLPHPVRNSHLHLAKQQGKFYLGHCGPATHLPCFQ